MGFRVPDVAPAVYAAPVRIARVLVLVVLGVGCSGGDDENAGKSCQAPADCYPGLEKPPNGEVMCLTRVTGGYCTHLCVTDADCCAVTGECKTGFPQVCAPFESTGQRICFLSCESNVLAGTDSNAYCQVNANRAFNCRSSGGGSENRKICTP
jgi:hypothetical protein